MAALTAIACGEGSDAIDGIAADDGVGRIDGSRRPDGPNELAVYQGGSRIKMRVGTTEDGAKTFLGWRDTMRDEDCSFVRADDGTQRCYPASGATVSSNYYAGGSCTTLLAVGGACSVPPTYAAENVEPDTACGYGVRLYTIAGSYTGSEVYQRFPEGYCLAQPLPDGVVLYMLGDAIPPSEFAVATEALE